MSASKIKEITTQKIIQDGELNLKFKNIIFNKIDIKGYIYTGDFILDSFNYFPITTNNYNTLRTILTGVLTYYNRVLKRNYSGFDIG